MIRLVLIAVTGDVRSGESTHMHILAKVFAAGKYEDSVQNLDLLLRWIRQYRCLVRAYMCSLFMPTLLSIWAKSLNSSNPFCVCD